MIRFNNQKHGFHLVNPSPWPVLCATGGLMITFGLAMYMHGYTGGFGLFRYGFCFVVIMAGLWWRDVIREATYEGQHTKCVQKGLKLGMILFIVSEIMFFFAFFWAFFHSSFNPSTSIGAIWPPCGITVLNPWEIPFLNTVILLTSGATITVCHLAIVDGDHELAANYLEKTIIAAIIFTLLQYYEYITAPFTISDGVYGSVFYMATGFHGFHVLVGTCFLCVCLLRLELEHFTREHHIGFEAAAWYWHFVDVVWLFLFTTIYWWGS